MGEQLIAVSTSSKRFVLDTRWWALTALFRDAPIIYRATLDAAFRR